MTIAPIATTIEARGHGTTVRLLAGDITQVSVGALVTTANSALAGCSGVEGAIHDEQSGRIHG
jgi:O-acetyl-ADP-ribose deacetylase (regulator of RNase III)